MPQFFILFLLSPSLLFSTVLTSNHLKGLYEEGSYIFKGNVVLKNKEMNLKADYLKYNSHQKSILAKGSLYILHEPYIINAYKLERLKNKSTIEGYKNSLVHTFNKKEKRTILSKILIIVENNKKDTRYSFIGSPILEDENLKISSKNQMNYNTQKGILNLMEDTTIFLKKEKSTITSSDVQFFNKKKQVVFSNKLLIDKKDDYNLQADGGFFNTENSTVNLTNNIVYKTKDITIKSDKLISKKMHQKEKYYLFSENIFFSYKGFKGSSKKIKAIPSIKTTEFTDNIKLTNKKNNLVLKADIMDVIDQQKKILFYSHVSIKTDEKTASADTGLYDEITDQFTLRGNAHYSDGNNNYKSKKIIVNNKTGDVSLIGKVQGTSDVSNLEGMVMNAK